MPTGSRGFQLVSCWEVAQASHRTLPAQRYWLPGTERQGHKDRINLCRAKVQPVGTLLEGHSGLLQPDSGWARASPKTGWALASSCFAKRLWKLHQYSEPSALLPQSLLHLEGCATQPEKEYLWPRRQASWLLARSEISRCHA